MIEITDNYMGGWTLNYIDLYNNFINIEIRLRVR